MEQTPTPELVRHLCQELEAKGIAYCHWKSNVMLDRSASGVNDLDLLVKRADAQRFIGLLYQLGLKEAQAAPEGRHPGVIHYYGYDAETGRMVHIHAHYQLILGHDLLKDYHLLMETPFLERTVQNGLLRVPIPELEFIVFIVRMMLKRPFLDVRGRGSLSAAMSQELQYLQSKVNRDLLSEMLATHVPSISPQLFDDCVHSLQAGCSPWTRMKVAWQLGRALQASRRHAWWTALAIKTWRRLAAIVRWRLMPSSSRKRLVHGGALVAIVGGDGAGKTTAVQEVSRWLAHSLDTMPVHMGKPARSGLTFVIDQMIRFRHLAHRSARGEKSVGSREPGTLLWSLRCVCTARDRYRTYLKARRFASNGGIAVCDRYPLPQIKHMDAPQLAPSGSGMHQPARWARSLARMEEGYYRQISAPDLLMVLRAPPDVAVQRKTEESAESVRRRSREIWELDWRQANTHVVDAGRSQPDVLSELKSLVWSNL